MIRRIRRDLSNKKVRKIVKKKLKESRNQPGRYPRSSSNILNFIKPIFYFCLFILFIFLFYKLTESINFSEFFTNKISDSITSNQDSAERIAQIPETGQQQPDESSEEQINPQPIIQKSQVEVLNGCGVAGTAKKTTAYLRKSDIDVVYMGNFSSFNVAKTQVIDLVGDKDVALKIAEILGIEDSQVKTEIDESKQLSASIILGKDYKILKPFK